MSLPAVLSNRLRLPLVAAPLFLASTPRLVEAQCHAGIVGSMPALNARSAEMLDDWLAQLSERLCTPLAAPFAINQIVSRSNRRQEQDLALLVKHKVPVVITSVGAPGEVVDAVHGYGGIVFHDVISVRHAEKAVAAGVDGIVAVCAGAGGHGGTLNPLAFVNEIRRFYTGTVLLSGGLTTGKDLVAAQIMGADLGYVGTRFLATQECEIDEAYKQMLLASNADQIVNTALFSGLRANYLKQSIARAGLDPDNLPPPPAQGGTGGHNGARLWKDIWAAGQGVGNIDDIPTVAQLIARFEDEYHAVRLPAQRAAAV
ncbi:2-nitropropane dioxygenase [Pseudomonas sp. S04]|uniref:NAD(P)H-dependent flavin oxidoreductase n=1 Tax=unclassified Pseudomonas TaxID=196821 RepID=UPI00131FC262|nr:MULTISPECIES: nitronate monooxygenase family protein [unclassified Pseudomonas]QHD01500.1 2-nitropropane dioxygenase [Pseudomonas sp. S04]QHF33984.1 2-nitropropane dioxygenase [Pseudomonas sp. S19]